MVARLVRDEEVVGSNPASPTVAKLQVIIGSTRPGRIGLPIAQWFFGQAQKHGGFEQVELIDLAEVNLPLLDEPNHPRLHQYEHEHTIRWSATVASADAFVFVTPEYNYSVAPALLNAIDYLFNEWKYKPVGFVSYGGISGGLRSVQGIKQAVTTLKMMPLPEAVVLPFAAKSVEDGVFNPPDGSSEAATTMLDELVRVEAALATLRK